ESNPVAQRRVDVQHDAVRIEDVAPIAVVVVLAEDVIQLAVATEPGLVQEWLIIICSSGRDRVGCRNRWLCAERLHLRLQLVHLFLEFLIGCSGPCFRRDRQQEGGSGNQDKRLLHGISPRCSVCALLWAALENQFRICINKQVVPYIKKRNTYRPTASRISSPARHLMMVGRKLREHIYECLVLLILTSSALFADIDV